jgi:hypothetical protein
MITANKWWNSVKQAMRDPFQTEARRAMSRRINELHDDRMQRISETSKVVESGTLEEVSDALDRLAEANAVYDKEVRSFLSPGKKKGAL